MTLSYGMLAVIIAGSAIIAFMIGFQLGKQTRRTGVSNLVFNCTTGDVTGSVSGDRPHELAAKVFAGSSTPPATPPLDADHKFWGHATTGGSNFSFPGLSIPPHTGTLTVAVWAAFYGEPASQDFQCSPTWGVRSTSTYSVEKPAVPGFKPPAMPVFSVAPSQGAGEGVRS